MLALLLGLASADPTPEPLRGPVREDDHPRYLDADDRPVSWHEVAVAARRTEVMAGIHRRCLGRNTLRVVFTGAAVAEGYGTMKLVEQDSDWAWVLGAQAGLTGLAAVLLFSEIPRARRIERAEMLDAANGWWRNHPGVR